MELFKSPVHARGNQGACCRYYRASSCHSYGQFSPRPVPPWGALRGRALLPGSVQAGLTGRCGPHLSWVGRVRVKGTQSARTLPRARTRYPVGGDRENSLDEN